MTTCHPYEPSLAKTEQGTDLRYGTPGIQLFSADRAVDIVVNAANAHGVRVIAFSLSFPFGLGFILGISPIDDWSAQGFIKTLHGTTDIWLLQSSRAEAGEAADKVMLVREATGQTLMALFDLFTRRRDDWTAGTVFG
jgi:hypothetical protein